MPTNPTPYWKQLLNSALGAALNGAASAQNSGADLKTVGVAAGATALTGVLAHILTHPLGQTAAVQNAVASVTPAPPNQPS